MDEFKCPVVQIPEIVKHPNADTLGIVTVEGTVCIVRLGDFQPGDLAVLVPLDSLVPTSRPEFAFLAKGDVGKTVVRVKAMKLRGTFSDGLVVKNPGLKLGQDAAGVLGITKWSPGEMGSASSYTEPNTNWFNKVRRAFMTWFLGFAFVRKLFGVRNRPSFRSGERPKFYLSSGKECPTYGLDKYAKYRNLLDNQEIWVSDKIHGANHRLVKDGTEVFVGSHYTVRRQDDSDTYWKAAQSVDLVAKLANDQDLIVFGEVIGVQDLKYGCEKDSPGYRAFDVLDLKAGRYLDFDQFQEFCKTREIPMVPVLYRGPHDPTVVESLTNAKKPLMSVIDGKTLREGVVIKPTQEPNDYRVRMALKHVSQHYLMRADGTEYK